MFDSQEEAQMRLDSTTIQGPDGPIYIQKMTSRSEFMYRKFSPRGGLDNGEYGGSLKDPGVSVRPFPLGYLNTEKQALYTQRVPIRKYKQGLSPQSLRVSKNRSTADRKGDIDPSRVLYHGRGFYLMCKGDYPTLHKCMELLEEGHLSVAFDRAWAVGRRADAPVGLYYKTKQVGVVAEGGKPELGPEHKYLGEALEEALR